MLVYRIEHPHNQRGPYYNTYMDDECGDSSFLEEMAFCHSFSHRNTHPIMKKETGDSNTGRNGFESIDKLKQWFHGYRKGLRQHSFVMAVYQVKRLLDKDEFQVLFSVGRAKKIRVSRIP